MSLLLCLAPRRKLERRVVLLQVTIRHRRKMRLLCGYRSIRIREATSSSCRMRGCWRKRGITENTMCLDMTLRTCYKSLPTVRSANSRILTANSTKATLTPTRKSSDAMTKSPDKQVQITHCSCSLRRCSKSMQR